MCSVYDVGHSGSCLCVEVVKCVLFRNVLGVTGSISCGDAFVSSVFYVCFAEGLGVVSSVVFCWSALWFVFALYKWLLLLGSCVWLAVLYSFRGPVGF